MKKIDEILRTLGRMEGQFDAMHSLQARVARLERWQYWLKGVWTVLLWAWVILGRQTFLK